jgi:hypothetical protein
MKIQLLFEPRDMWVGLYWTVDEYDDGTFEAFVHGKYRWRFYICVVPMLPLLITLDENRL